MHYTGYSLPLSELSFTLHKGAFRDAIKLRYGWQLPCLPSHCTCGKKFTVEHAFRCPCGGFPSLRHNDIRDITADFLTEVSPSVSVEPMLQPLTGEQLQYKTANSEDDARADVISAQGFWGDKRQLAFFDVRVFNPHAPSCSNSSLASTYRRHEKEKRRAYQQRILEVEHGSFTPLAFSATGGMGPAATVTYRRIASLLAEKRAQPYSRTIGWLRCVLNFSLIRSAIQCIRGARSARHRPCRSPIDSSIALTTGEGRSPANNWTLPNMYMFQSFFFSNCSFTVTHNLYIRKCACVPLLVINILILNVHACTHTFLKPAET